MKILKCSSQGGGQVGRQDLLSLVSGWRPFVAFPPQHGEMEQGHAFTNPHGKEKTGAVCYSQLVFFSSNSLSYRVCNHQKL